MDIVSRVRMMVRDAAQQIRGGLPVTPQRGVLVRRVPNVQDRDRVRLIRHSVR